MPENSVLNSELRILYSAEQDTVLGGTTRGCLASCGILKARREKGKNMAYDGMPSYDDTLPDPNADIPATIGPLCDLATVQGVCGNQSCNTIIDDFKYEPSHDCAIQNFLDDPITQAYGLGGDMDEWSRVIHCAYCDAEWEKENMS